MKSPVADPVAASQRGGRFVQDNLNAVEQRDLWDCLFLTLLEIEALLQYVEENARQPFLYPMFCFAAHTGARRSEMLRSRRSDVDFVGETVLIREKKRAKEKRTTRRVPLSPFLAAVLRDWLLAPPTIPGPSPSTRGSSQKPVTSTSLSWYFCLEASSLAANSSCQSSAMTRMALSCAPFFPEQAGSERSSPPTSKMLPQVVAIRTQFHEDRGGVGVRELVGVLRKRAP